MNWWKVASVKIASGTWTFMFPDGRGHVKLPVVYLRFGELPLGPDGKPTVSTNHWDKVKETGISVYPAYAHPNGYYVLPSGDEQFMNCQFGVADRAAYLVDGVEIDTGSDGEPVLDPASIRIIKMVPPTQIVGESDKHITIDGGDVPEARIPYLPGERQALDEQARRHRDAMEQQNAILRQRHDEQMQAIRALIQQHPQYRENFEKMYPQLRQSSSNWWKIAQSQKWYHGTSRDYDTFDPSKSDSSNAWGPGMYLTPERADAEAWGRKGGGNVRVLEVPHPTGKVFPADGLVPVEDLPAIDALLGGNFYAKKGEPVPGALIYMSLERKLGDKGRVNAALKSIGYEGLTYAINRGKDMQHMVRFASSNMDNWGLPELEQYFAANKDRFLADPQAQEDLRTKGMVSSQTLLRLVGNQGVANYCQRMLSKLPEVQQASQTAAKARDEAYQREMKDDYLYHVAPKANLRTIKTRGLIPNGAKSNFGPQYADHVKGRTFLCEKGAIGYWSERILTNREAATGGRIKLAVVRIPKAALQGKLQADQPGTSDSKHDSYFITEPIPPSVIEVVSA